MNVTELPLGRTEVLNARGIGDWMVVWKANERDFTIVVFSGVNTKAQYIDIDPLEAQCVINEMLGEET